MKALLLILLVGLCLPVFAVPEIVYYPRPATVTDRRSEYPLELLKRALALSGRQYYLRPSKQRYPQSEALKQLNLGDRIDVVWSMTSEEREQRYRPVRIPIYQGLIGWRVFLIQQERAKEIGALAELETLRGYQMVQGFDWPDRVILEANEIRVIPAQKYEDNFIALRTGEAELFPRSVIEVWGELTRYENRGLQIDNTHLLIYPTAAYYFVAADNERLARDIKVGLEMMIEIGEYRCLLLEYFGELLQKAELNKRVVHALNNPLLPPKTPLARRELWFRTYSTLDCR